MTHKLPLPFPFVRVVSGGRIKVQMSTSDRHTNEVVQLPPRPAQQPNHESW